MKRSTVLKIVALFALVAMLIPASFALSACGEKKEEKKGIIICTALLSGSLMYSENGLPLWDPLTENVAELSDIITEDNDFEVSDSSVIGNIVANILGNKYFMQSFLKTDGGAFDLLTLDEEGVASNGLEVVTEDSEYRQKYGILGIYEEFYNELKTRYGKDYEVTVWNYDWRLDNRVNAETLEKYIADKGYDKVILTAHSMGGNVVSNFLARSQKNRDMVEAYFSYGTPYLGAQMALATLEDLDFYVDLVKMLENDPSFGTIAKSLNLVERVQNYVLPMARSWVSLYQLLPTPELLSEDGLNGYCCITLDGEPITDADALYEFYESRFWAKYDDGTLRKAVKELRDYNASSYVEVDGKLVHSTTLVNTYYFAGNDFRTSTTISYISDGNVGWIFDDESSSYEGDGTVLKVSAAAGQTTDNVNPLNHNCHIWLGLKFDYSKDIICGAIDKIIEDNKTPTRSEIFENLCNNNG